MALEKAVKEETSAGEPSLVIARRPCALLKNVPVNKPLRIDRDKCKYCRMCLRIGCPAIADRGTYVEINDALCNGCTFCTGICRFDAINN